MLAARVAAVVAHFRAEQARADEDFFHERRIALAMWEARGEVRRGADLDSRIATRQSRASHIAARTSRIGDTISPYGSDGSD
jgi:hypothetical protein